jgi:hypothetical protein
MKLFFVFSSVLCCLAAAQNALSATSQEAAEAAAAAKLLLSMPKCGVCAINLYPMDETDGNLPACLPSSRRSGVFMFTHRSCMLLHQHDAPGAGSALRSRELLSPRLTQYAPRTKTSKRTRSDIWQPRRTHQPPFAIQINQSAMQRRRLCTLPCSALRSLLLPLPCG